VPSVTLASPGARAALRKERRLLIAAHGTDRNRATEPVGGGGAVAGVGGAHLGQRVARNAEHGHRGGPVERERIVEAGGADARDVGGVHSTASELVDEPGVDGAEQQIALLRRLGDSGDVLKHPVVSHRGVCRCEMKTSTVFEALGARDGVQMPSRCS
jgi:hypothetical protein